MRGSEKKEGSRERRAGKRLRMKEESRDGSRAEGAGEGGRDGAGRRGNRNERTEGNGGTDRLLRIGQEGRREKTQKEADSKRENIKDLPTYADTPRHTHTLLRSVLCCVSLQRSWEQPSPKRHPRAEPGRSR